MKTESKVKLLFFKLPPRRRVIAVIKIKLFKWDHSIYWKRLSSKHTSVDFRQKI